MADYTELGGGSHDGNTAGYLYLICYTVPQLMIFVIGLTCKEKTGKFVELNASDSPVFPKQTIKTWRSLRQ